MIGEMYEIYERQVEKWPNNTTVARFAHWLIAKALKEDMAALDIAQVLHPYGHYQVLLDDPTGHVPDATEFKIQDISMQLNTSMSPNRIYVPGIMSSIGTARQFTFRLDNEGRPAYQLYSHSTHTPRQW